MTPTVAQTDPDPSDLERAASTVGSAGLHGLAREDFAPDDIPLHAQTSNAQTSNAQEPVETAAPQVEPETRASRPAPREAARKAGRPSVPAWDEIMFGSRPGADRSSQ